MKVLNIPSGRMTLTGDLVVPAQAEGIVVIAPRDRPVADALVDEGFATLMLDLLTGDDLAECLVDAVEWVARGDTTAGLPVGLFGAAAALTAAARLRNVSAVVAQTLDLDEEALADVPCPTMLIVGSGDQDVVELDGRAPQPRTVVHVAAGTDEVAEIARAWFHKHLIGAHARAEPAELWNH